MVKSRKAKLSRGVFSKTLLHVNYNIATEKKQYKQKTKFEKKYPSLPGTGCPEPGNLRKTAPKTCKALKFENRKRPMSDAVRRDCPGEKIRPSA
ncbi:MAG: hypothetical protein K5647_07835 [Clostridiales bacterium]|nr:hypothetical protein [Clostridiales bacterium]